MPGAVLVTGHRRLIEAPVRGARVVTPRAFADSFLTGYGGPVKTRRLGSTRRPVHPIGLGCMGLSWAYHDAAVDEAEAIALIWKAIDLDVDHFDTSDADFRSTLPRFSPEAVAANQRIVDAVRAVAQRRGATAAQIALARGEHVLAIPGTQRAKYLEQNVAELDAIPAPVGGRYYLGESPDKDAMASRVPIAP